MAKCKWNVLFEIPKKFVKKFMSSDEARRSGKAISGFIYFTISIEL